MRTYGTSETFNVTPSRIVNIIMLNMLVGMKDSNVKYVINDLAASQDKKSLSGRIVAWLLLHQVLNKHLETTIQIQKNT